MAGRWLCSKGVAQVVVAVLLAAQLFAAVGVLRPTSAQSAPEFVCYIGPNGTSFYQDLTTGLWWILVDLKTGFNQWWGWDYYLQQNPGDYYLGQNLSPIGCWSNTYYTYGPEGSLLYFDNQYWYIKPAGSTWFVFGTNIQACTYGRGPGSIEAIVLGGAEVPTTCSTGW
jgi:hypothetical protein